MSLSPDERTLLLLAAEALRRPVAMGVESRRRLADALERIAGVERVNVLEDCEGDDPRFRPDPPMPWEKPETTRPRGWQPMPDGCDTAVFTKDHILFGKREESNAGVRGSTPVVASAGDPTGERMAPAPSRFTPKSEKPWSDQHPAHYGIEAEEAREGEK